MILVDFFRPISVLPVALKFIQPIRNDRLLPGNGSQFYLLSHTYIFNWFVTFRLGFLNC